MDFPNALSIVLSGGVVTRQSWSGSGLTLGVMAPPSESGIMPFLAIRASDGKIVAWAPGQQELFAKDWVQVQGESVGHG